MTPLSYTQTPNKGWQFRQIQANWSVANPVSKTLDQVTDEVIRMRLKNPAMTAQHGLATDFNTVRQEVYEFNRLRLGAPAAPPPKFMPHQPGQAGAVVGHAAKTAAGINLMAQWFGAGMKPVANELAENRASICVDCPKNRKGDLWQRLDAIAARELRNLIEKKNQMALKTSYDDKLQTCIACDCWLPLKVWTPLQHILNNTAPEVTSQLDHRCWILHET